MFGLEGLRDLYAHMEWADAAIWRATLRSDTAVADEELRRRLYHIHLTQRAFLQVWTGQPLDSYDPNRFTDTRDLYRWARSYHDEIPGLFAGLTEERLRQSFVVPWAKFFQEEIGRPPAPCTMAETLFQVTSHSNYHRGQVNTRLKQIGVAPAPVDYIAWLWRARPASEWP